MSALVECIRSRYAQSLNGDIYGVKNGICQELDRKRSELCDDTIYRRVVVMLGSLDQEHEQFNLPVS